MRTVTSRIAKLERRLQVGDGALNILVIMCNAGCDLDHDWCCGILRKHGVLGDAGVRVVNLGMIPFGLNAEELARFLREHGAEICGGNKNTDEESLEVKRRQ